MATIMKETYEVRGVQTVKNKTAKGREDQYVKVKMTSENGPELTLKVAQADERIQPNAKVQVTISMDQTKVEDHAEVPTLAKDMAADKAKAGKKGKDKK